MKPTGTVDLGFYPDLETAFAKTQSMGQCWTSLRLWGRRAVLISGAEVPCPAPGWCPVCRVNVLPLALFRRPGRSWPVTSDTQIDEPPPSSSRRPCPQCCLPLPSPTAFCSWPQDLTGCKVVCHQGSLSLLPVSLFSKIWLRVDVGQGCWWGDVDGDENGSQ